MSGQFDRVVQPGQSGKIPIKITTGHATGPITKTITVLTNVAGANATMTLQIKGELWQVIQATPNAALFGNISPASSKDGPAVRKLTIVNNSDTPGDLSTVTSNSAAFKGELKALEPGKKWELTVTLASSLATGVQSGMIEIPTGMPDLPKLQIACSAYLVADVDVVPNKMMIPATRTVNLQRDFYVRNNASKPLKVTDLTASNPLMKVGIQETQTGMAFRITLDVPPEYKVAKEGDKITFKTDHPSFPQIAIPVTEAPVGGPQTLPLGKPALTNAPQPVTVGKTPPGNPPVVPGQLQPAAKPGAAPVVPPASAAKPVSK